MKPDRDSMLAMAIAVSSCLAQADCPPVKLESRQYAEATRTVQQLPEFRQWQRYVEAHPPAHIVLGAEPFVKNVRIRGRCFVSVSIHSDEGTHLHRWNTFFVSARPRTVLVQDLEGEPVGLAAWRRSNRPVP